MTKAATTIALLESAAPDHDAMHGLLDPHATDVTLREIVEATYDPFLEWGCSSSDFLGPNPRPIEDPDSADVALASEWASFREMLETTHRNQLRTGVHPFAESPAWPVYERVMRKRFTEVPFDVANHWGTLPVFRCAPIEPPVDPPIPNEWPGVAVRVPNGARRCLIVVRDPHSGAVADFFDVCGLCGFRTLIHGDVQSTVDALDFSILERDGPFEDGVVFDGWIARASGGPLYDMYRAFDIVPLSEFRVQRRTAPFLARRAFLDEFRSFKGGGPFNVAPFLKVANSLDAQKALDEPGGIFTIDAEAAYPFSRPSSWRWIRTGDSTFD